jgi:cytosol alanyl aminopeptidase
MIRPALPARHLVFALLAACGSTPPAVAPPTAPAPDAAVAVTPPKPDPEPPKFRLPSGVVPIGYDLALDLDPDRPTFAGQVTITLSVIDDRAALWLHAEQLQISRAVLDGGTALRVLDRGDVIGLVGDAPIGSGAHQITLDYTGAVTSSLSGLFAQSHGGRNYLYSQLEPVGARRVVPCLDEPLYKSAWRIAVTAPAGHRAYSNGPVEAEDAHADGRVTHRFAETPPISSYLVAVAVGPFDEVDVGPVGRGQIPARIIVPAGLAGEATTAAAMMPRLVTALENYFDMPIPLAKLDSVAVPMFPGAMENPGLVTYASNILLAPPERADPRFRAQLAMVGGHELAHQWFGNYVTMAWWDDIWLNESFATWMGEKVAAQVEPSYDHATSVITTADKAMRADGTRTAHALHRPVTTADAIGGVFDAISYSKGGAVLTMFERWIGEGGFRDGVRAYMTANARGTATNADFVAALAAASAPEIGAAFHAYLDRPGVPVVEVGLACPKGEPPRVRLRQSRLTGFGEPADDTVWPVRACVRWGGKGGKPGGEACDTIEDREAELVLADAKACPAWLVGNADGVGYYRTRYEPALAAALRKHLGKVAALDRLSHATDTRALLGAGRVTAADALALVDALVATRGPEDLASAVELVAATERLVSEEMVLAWRTWVVRTLARPARAAALDPPADETAAARDARHRLLHLVGVTARDARLGARARKRVDRWLAGKAKPPADLALVLTIAARAGDARLFDALLERQRSTTDPHARAEIVTALGQFTDPALIARAYELLSSGDLDLAQRSAFVQGQLASVDGARRIGVFLRTHWDAVIKDLPAMAIPYVIRMQGAACDQASRDEVASVFSTHADQAAVADALASIDACLVRRDALSGDLAKIIKAR